MRRTQQPHAWAAPSSGVRGVSLGVRIATLSTRTTHSCAPYIRALTGSLPASVFLFLIFARNSSGFKICAFAPSLYSAPLLFSALCTPLGCALVSSLVSSPPFTRRARLQQYFRHNIHQVNISYLHVTTYMHCKYVLFAYSIFCVYSTYIRIYCQV